MTKQEELVMDIQNLLLEKVDIKKTIGGDYTALAWEIVEMCLAAGMKPPSTKFDPITLQTKHTWE